MIAAGNLRRSLTDGAGTGPERRKKDVMEPYPHSYSVDAPSTGNGVLAAAGVSPLQSAPPAQFDGPGLAAHAV